MSNPASSQKRSEVSRSTESITLTDKHSSQAYIPKRERVSDSTRVELDYNPELHVNSMFHSGQFQSRALE